MTSIAVVPAGGRAQSSDEKDYLEQAKNAANSLVGVRPNRFTVNAGALWGLNASTKSMADLDAQAQALAFLGFNTVHVKDWNGDLVDIDAVLRAQGLRRASFGSAAPIAISTVPEYEIGPSPRFTEPTVAAAFRGKICPVLPNYKNVSISLDHEASDASLACWAQNQYSSAFAGSAATSEDVALVQLSDENAILFCLSAHECKEGTRLCESGTNLNRVCSGDEECPGSKCSACTGGICPEFCRWNPDTCVCQFRRYLELHAPDLLPGTLPNCRDDLVDTSTSRRTLYWSTQFFQESMAALAKREREALESATLNHGITTYYNSPPDYLIWGAFKPVPQRDLLVPTPALLGHRHAATPWSWDYFTDTEAETTSLYADALASAAASGQLGFGSYVVGADLGDHPSGASYKILSLIGHGAKAFTVYYWDNWKAKSAVYGPIAIALRRVGWGERLLYPGQRARGNVALLRNNSRLWDDAPALSHHAQEVYGLDYALRHAGYVVDVIDDEDIVTDGALETRGYTTLYLTEANLSEDALGRIVSWVSTRGGTVAVMPGAGTMNEFNEPGSVAGQMDTLLGATSRAVVPASHLPANTMGTYPGCPSQALRTADPPVLTLTAEFGESPDESPVGTTLALSGSVAPLELDTTPHDELATVKLSGATSSQPAITAKTYGGGGRAIAFGFFPGWQYWTSPARQTIGSETCAEGCRSPCGFPQNWQSVSRNIAVQPAVLAHTGKPVAVTDNGHQVDVEVNRLDSEQGIALVLLNWTFKPLPNPIRVTVRGAARFKKVSSYAEKNPISSNTNGNDLTFDLPELDAVDVVLLEEDVLLIDDLCKNGVRDGKETDTDCGGGECPDCSDTGDTGGFCFSDSDCASGRCDRYGSTGPNDKANPHAVRPGRCVGPFPDWHVWYYDFLWKLRGMWKSLFFG